MKKILVLIVFYLFFGTVMGQGKGDFALKTLYSALRLEKDSYKDVKKLPQYEAEPCVFGLLDDIAENDDNCSRQIGYYFSCVKIEGKILLKINPVNLGRLPVGNFFGYFIYKKRTFLCCGDIRCYVSRRTVNNPLVLRSFTSDYPQVADLYIGGDTDGVLKIFSCNNENEYVLVKMCMSPVQQKTRRK